MPNPICRHGYYEAGVESLDSFYDAMELESYLAADKDWVKNWAGAHGGR